LLVFDIGRNLRATGWRKIQQYVRAGCRAAIARQ
jgi:hypothetical protein